MSSFVSNTEFLQRYDWRTVAQLTSDSGSANTQDELATDSNLTLALEDASGEVLSYALKGGRYQLTDLTSLTDISQAFLNRLVCDLAYFHLVERRGKSVEDYPQYDKAQEILEQIGSGHQVFNVAAVINAGAMQSPTISPQTIANENYVRDSIRYFPTRRYTREQI